MSKEEVFVVVFLKNEKCCAVVRRLLRVCKGEGGWEQTDIDVFSL